MGLICVGEFSRLPSLVMLMNSENRGQINKLPVLLNLEEKLLLLGGMKLGTQYAMIVGKKPHTMVGTRSGATQLGQKQKSE